MKFNIGQLVRIKEEIWETKRRKYRKGVEWLPDNRFIVRIYTPGIKNYQIMSPGSNGYSNYSAHEDELEAIVE